MNLNYFAVSNQIRIRYRLMQSWVSDDSAGLEPFGTSAPSPSTTAGALVVTSDWESGSCKPVGCEAMSLRFSYRTVSGWRINVLGVGHGHGAHVVVDTGFGIG